MAQAILRNGQLLLPHDVGDGVDVISPDDPGYQGLRDSAVDLDSYRGTADGDAALARTFRSGLAADHRRSA